MKQQDPFYGRDTSTSDVAQVGDSRGEHKIDPSASVSGELACGPQPFRAALPWDTAFWSGE